MPLCLPMVRREVARPTLWALGLRWSAIQRLQVGCVHACACVFLCIPMFIVHKHCGMSYM